MSQIVQIDRVIPLADIARDSYAVRKMKSVLFKQGQIEPLQVHKFEDKFIVFHDDAWGNEIVYAARELGWDSLIIVEMAKYEA